MHVLRGRHGGRKNLGHLLSSSLSPHPISKRGRGQRRRHCPYIQHALSHNSAMPSSPSSHAHIPQRREGSSLSSSPCPHPSKRGGEFIIFIAIPTSPKEGEGPASSSSWPDPACIVAVISKCHRHHQQCCCHCPTSSPSPATSSPLSETSSLSSANIIAIVSKCHRLRQQMLSPLLSPWY